MLIPLLLVCYGILGLRGHIQGRIGVAGMCCWDALRGVLDVLFYVMSSGCF